MKCEKCSEAEATVYYTVISGKFKATRKRYCRKCMESERIRTYVPPPPQADGPAELQSVMDLVQNEMSRGEKDDASSPQSSDTVDKRIKKLEKQMQAAIGDEKYEEAAKIRDAIAALSKQSKSPSGDKDAKGPSKA